MWKILFPQCVSASSGPKVKCTFLLRDYLTGVFTLDISPFCVKIIKVTENSWSPICICYFWVYLYLVLKLLMLFTEWMNVFDWLIEFTRDCEILTLAFFVCFEHMPHFCKWNSPTEKNAHLEREKSTKNK